ncbi:hypothetical protein [Salininema proteolyticum]|uniref:DUF4145 domain-containing protein n=1 Tax=Salininema proteolyticum TaxID=1607685 RepID=A0ABV8TUQ9_9ACTN
MADQERHLYLFRHLQESEHDDWSQIGERLLAEKIQLWDLAFEEPYATIIQEGLEVDPDETREFIDLIRAHLAGEPTILSRARAAHPDFRAGRDYDHTISDTTPSDDDIEAKRLVTLALKAPSEFSSRKVPERLINEFVNALGDKIRATASRNYGMAGNGDQGMIAASLAEDSDLILRSLGHAMQRNAIDLSEVPDHPDMRRLARESPRTAMELLKTVVEYLYVEVPVPPKDTWGLKRSEDDEYSSMQEKAVPDSDDDEMSDESSEIEQFDLSELRSDPWGINRHREYDLPASSNSDAWANDVLKKRRAT